MPAARECLGSLAAEGPSAALAGADGTFDGCPPTVAPALGVFAATTTLTQNILGAGVLAIPYAIESAGLLGGFLVMALVYALSLVTMVVLVLLANHLGGELSFKGFASQTLGRCMPGLIEVWVLMYNLGICIAYAILLGDFSHEIFASWGMAWLTKRLGMIVATLGVCFPLSCAPSLGFLQWMSTVGNLGVLFTLFVVILRYADGSYASEPSSPMVLINWSTFGDCFPVLVVAFGAHFNVPALYKELAPGAGSPEWGSTRQGARDFRRMSTVVGASLTIASLIYGVVGITVYSMFGSRTASDFSENFRANDELLVVVRLMLTLALCACFPLVVMSARNALFRLELVPTGLAMTTTARIVITMFITFVVLIVAIGAGDIGSVLAYCGSIFGAPVCYIVPGVMYLRLPRHTTSTTWRRASMMCAIAGSVFGILGIVAVAAPGRS